MSLSIPTNEESVAWAEEADRLAIALWNLMKVIMTDDLIPTSVSYMMEANNALVHWPDPRETKLVKERIWDRIQSEIRRNKPV